MVRIIDVIDEEKVYTKNIVGSNIEYIDFNTRNSFFSGSMVLMLKYTSKFNQHGTQNKLMNDRVVPNECPCCYEKEDWDHIVKYKALGS